MSSYCPNLVYRFVHFAQFLVKLLTNKGNYAKIINNILNAFMRHNFVMWVSFYEKTWNKSNQYG